MVVSMSRWVTRMSFIYFAHAAFSRQTVANQGQDEPIRTSSCPHVHCMSYGQWPNGTHGPKTPRPRSEEQTSELQSLMSISYAVYVLNIKTTHIRRLSPYKVR